MADGTTKRIDQIKPGDRVMAKNPVDGTTAPQTVSQVILGAGHKTLVEITIDEQRGFATPHTQSKVVATDGHPFFLPKTRTWVEAGDLHPGDRLAPLATAATATVAATKSYQTDAQVYNLTVATAHTYFVVANSVPVLVHNDNGPDWDGDWRKLVESWDPGDRGKDDGYRAPRGNQAENKQFNDALRKVEQEIGRKVTPAERNTLHGRISGKGYDYHQLVDETRGC